jgi:putative drug exporter of the RND superfamily
LATLLYRLGRACAQRRRLVVAAWLIVLVAIGIAAATLKGTTDDGFSVPGTEAQRAIDLLDQKFPGTGGATARVVFAAPRGHTLDEPQYQKLLDPTLALVRRVPQTVPGTGAQGAAKRLVVSRDRRIGFGDINFTVPVADVSDSTKDALEKVAEPARAAGLEVEFSGGIVATGSGKQGNTEAIGIIVAFVVLMVTFGALSSAILPLATAIMGVAIGLLTLTAATGIFTLSSTAPTLATMLGLAVGIDYALFIVSRHRQQVAAGTEVNESIGHAVATAGSAVVFAGLTVVIALVGLLITGIPFLSAMGLGAAFTVVVAVLIALTLLPALLGFVGARAAKGRHPGGAHMPFGERWATWVTSHPWPVMLGVIVVLLLAAVPALRLDLGLPDAGTKPKADTQRKAYDLLTEGFGPGFNGPLTVVLDASDSKDYKQVGAQATRALGQFRDVAVASPAVSNSTGKVSIVSVTPASGPSTDATKDLVKSIRAQAKLVRDRYKVDILVTGPTAINIDVSDKLASALPPFLIFIVGLALLLLLLVFRSILVPIKAVLGFLFTIAAALGGVVFIFEQGHLQSLLGVAAKAPVLSFLPVLMIAILFGLAMDYQVFLVTRVREAYVHRDEPIPAVREGFRASARVVTAAALIMISVFSGFIIGDDPIIKSIGFALAFGVLVDAFFVRMTLVPAVLALLGRSAWWLPGWLQKHLPDLDIEGARLQAPAPAEPAAPTAAAGSPRR